MPSDRKRKAVRNRKTVKKVKFGEPSLFDVTVKLTEKLSLDEDPCCEGLPPINYDEDDMKELYDRNSNELCFKFQDKFRGSRAFKQRWQNFKLRAGMDPYYSSCDPVFKEIGIKGSEMVRQNMKNEYESWEDAKRHQMQKFDWKIWLDPSASAIILPVVHQNPANKLNSKIVNKNPCTLNFEEQFGSATEFVYISPPWKTDRHGYGKKGWFTDKHLKKFDLSFQKKGFVFIWGCYDYHHQVFEIMDKKGYVYCDSVSAIIADWHGKIEMKPRNPKPVSCHDSVMSRTAGTTVQGLVFKRIVKHAYRLGNQICCDCFLWRRKKDRETGQLKYDHGYAYQLHEYMCVDKPKTFNPKEPHAIHVFCDEKFSRNHWAGVRWTGPK